MTLPHHPLKPTPFPQPDATIGYSLGIVGDPNLWSCDSDAVASLTAAVSAAQPVAFSVIVSAHHARVTDATTLVLNPARLAGYAVTDPGGGSRKPWVKSHLVVPQGAGPGIYVLGAGLLDPSLDPVGPVTVLDASHTVADVQAAVIAGFTAGGSLDLRVDDDEVLHLLPANLLGVVLFAPAA